MFKKFVATVLVFGLLFGLTGIVSASGINDNKREDQINKIYQERASLLAEKKEGFEKEYDSLGKKLESLGVEFLTPEQVQIEMNKKAQLETKIRPQVSLPPSSNITWSSYRNKWVKNGVTYEVQHVTAESNIQNSQLKKTGTTLLFNSNSLNVGVSNLIRTVATTTLGSFDTYIGLGITVYDAVKSFISDSNFSQTTTVQDIKSSYTWNWYESVDFMFVKVANKSDSYQNLALVTSTVNGAVAYAIPTFTYNTKTGATKSASINQGPSKSFSYTALYHRDGSAAVNYFLSGPTKYSFVTKINLTGIEGKTVETIIPAQPIGMGALY